MIKVLAPIGIALMVTACVARADELTVQRDQSLQAPSSLTAKTIAGCCSYSIDSAAAEIQTGQPIDGFSSRIYQLGGEQVTVTPYLGYYGWLDLVDGSEESLGTHMGRGQMTSDGQKTVAAFRQGQSPQSMPLTVLVSTSCNDNARCSLYDTVRESFRIETKWESFDPRS